MRVKHFDSFDVRRYHRYDTALLFAFEFRGTQRAQCAEYFITQNRQQFERDKMIAVLLKVPQQSAQQSATYGKSYYPTV